MAKKTKARPAPLVEESLRNAFRAVEAQPAPDVLKEHVDRLTGEPPKPPRRN